MHTRKHTEILTARLVIEKVLRVFQRNRGLPWWLSGKESACNARDTTSVSGWGRGRFLRVGSHDFGNQQVQNLQVRPTDWRLREEKMFQFKSKSSM